MRSINSFCYRTHLKLLLILGIGVLPLMVPVPARAETDNTPQPGSAAQRFQSLWDKATLYRNPNNAVVQSFSLVGRNHGQYWAVDADQGEAEGWDNRRLVFGVQAEIFQDFQVEVQAKINSDFSPAYKELFTGFIKWKPEETNTSVTLGRVDYSFIGLERSTSSKKISTFERSLLVNQLAPGEAVGLRLETRLDELLIHGGVYSGNIEQEFSNFEAGVAVELGVAGDLPLFYDQGTLHLDFLYNDGNENNNAFKPYRQVASLWHQGQKGAFALGMDLTIGSGGFDEQGDVFGVTLLPTYDIADNLLIGGDKLQLVLRYQYAGSDQNNGLQLTKRYEQEVVSGSGDSYQALYAGLNYFLYGHRLKLMAGAEYSNMEDSANDGGRIREWTYLAGLRFYF